VGKLRGSAIAIDDAGHGNWWVGNRCTACLTGMTFTAACSDVGPGSGRPSAREREGSAIEIFIF
jgi:hypothetical protein